MVLIVSLVLLGLFHFFVKFSMEVDLRCWIHGFELGVRGYGVPGLEITGRLSSKLLGYRVWG